MTESSKDRFGDNFIGKVIKAKPPKPAPDKKVRKPKPTDKYGLR